MHKHFVDFIESVVAAVVGVGDIGGVWCAWVEGSHEADFLWIDAEGDEVVFVGLIHGDEEIEAVGIGGFVELACD